MKPKACGLTTSWALGALKAGAIHRTKPYGVLIFVNSVNSVKNHYFFFFFPPDFLPPVDLDAADFLDAEPLDFLAEDLPPPFFDF